MEPTNSKIDYFKANCLKTFVTCSKKKKLDPVYVYGKTLVHILNVHLVVVLSCVGFLFVYCCYFEIGFYYIA